MNAALPLLFLALAGTAWAQADWRRSDSLGNDKGPAGPADRQSGWVLRINSEQGSQERTLFHDGKEDSVRKIDLDAQGRVVRVREVREGLPVWETAYDPASGLPTSETSFQDGEPDRTAELRYFGKTLVQRSVKDAQGHAVYTDRLSHWPDGSLRRVERTGTEGPLSDSAWSYAASGLPTGAWAVTEEDRAKGTHREWKYSAGKTEESLLSSEGLLRTKVSERLVSGETREITTDLKTSQVEKRLLDSQGRTVEEIEEAKGVPEKVSRWSYDAEGRILSSSSEGLDSQEAWSYTYRDGKTLARLSRDGVVVREEISRDGDRLSVNLYDRGNLFLTETWKDGKKIKETYFQNGVVVRERTP